MYQSKIHFHHWIQSRSLATQFSSGYWVFSNEIQLIKIKLQRIKKNKHEKLINKTVWKRNKCDFKWDFLPFLLLINSFEDFSPSFTLTIKKCSHKYKSVDYFISILFRFSSNRYSRVLWTDTIRWYKNHSTENSGNTTNRFKMGTGEFIENQCIRGE